MEEEVLGALKFELTAPTPRVFLRRLVKAAAALGPPDPRCGQHALGLDLPELMSSAAALHLQNL